MERLHFTGHNTAEYWAIRRSLVFAANLRTVARDFRQHHLSSPYLAVHLRRSDFLYSRQKDNPHTMIEVARQLKDLLVRYSLTAIFVASDARADDAEFHKIFRDSFSVVQFPTGPVHKVYVLSRFTRCS